jgi:hypothetical protein
MEKTYELNLRDVLTVLEQQMASTEFNGQFEYTPYEEYDCKGDRVHSHLMSAYWASQEAVWSLFSAGFHVAHTANSQDTITEDPSTHGAMLVPVFSGSDKTTVSVATGHQEYHPIYASTGNISNTARRGHGNAVVPVTFLPILKSRLCRRKHIYFQLNVPSKQTPAEEAWIPDILPATLSCMLGCRLHTVKALHD